MLIKHSGFFLVFSLVIFSGCTGSKLGLAGKEDNLAMKISEQPDVINYAILANQTVPTLASRGTGGRNRGLAGSAISAATNAIKKMIAKEHAKYTANYSYALTDLYFYDQLSTASPFDPIGMQFNGFRLTRTFMNNGKLDTAMVAEIELDTKNPYEIINNSIFRLRLRSFQLNFAKAKILKSNGNKLNMDFEITFHTSYVNNEGVLFKDVELGKFYLTIRDAPLDKNAPGYNEYYNGLKGKLLDGNSFIVPRSFGYHITGFNNTEPSFSQGAYNIRVNVTESSRHSFVNQLIVDNSGTFVEMLDNNARKLLK